MRFGILAMESQLNELSDRLSEAASEHPLEDNEIDTLQEEGQGLQEERDRLDEAQAIQNTLGGINEHLKDSYVKGEGLTDPEAGALSVASEFFQARLGIRKPYVPSLESYTQDRKAATQALIRQNKLVMEALGDQLVLAQEGFGKRMLNSLKSMFTSNAKMRKMVQSLSRDYDTHGAREDLIVDPGWARHLNPQRKSKITGSDVLARVRSLHMEKDVAVFRSMDKIYRLAGRIASHPENIPEATLREVEKLTHELVDEANRLHMAIPQVATSGADGDFVPLESGEKNHMVEAIHRLLVSEEVLQAIDHFDEVYVLLHRASVRQVGVDENGDDIHEGVTGVGYAERVLGPTVEAFNLLYDIWLYRNKLGHSAVRYLQASIAYPKRFGNKNADRLKDPGSDGSTGSKQSGSMIGDFVRDVAGSLVSLPANF